MKMYQIHVQMYFGFSISKDISNDLYSSCPIYSLLVTVQLACLLQNNVHTSMVERKKIKRESFDLDLLMYFRSLLYIVMIDFHINSRENALMKSEQNMIQLFIIIQNEVLSSISIETLNFAYKQLLNDDFPNHILT